MNNSSPYWKHDSSCCKLLGSNCLNETQYDMYVCFEKSAAEYSLIIRRSDEPSDYSSFPNFVFNQIFESKLENEILGFKEAYDLVKTLFLKENNE